MEAKRVSNNLQKLVVVIVLSWVLPCQIIDVVNISKSKLSWHIFDKWSLSQQGGNSITEGFRKCFGEIQQMAFLPSLALPLFIRGTRLLAGRTPSVGFQNLIFVWRENNTL